MSNKCYSYGSQGNYHEIQYDLIDMLVSINDIEDGTPFEDAMENIGFKLINYTDEEKITPYYNIYSINAENEEAKKKIASLKKTEYEEEIKAIYKDNDFLLEINYDEDSSFNTFFVLPDVVSLGKLIKDVVMPICASNDLRQTENILCALETSLLDIRDQLQNIQDKL